MAKAPITQLKKAEIIELFKGRCKHGHNYLEHYNCYLEEAKKEKRIGFLDIEASNLNADFGIAFCYCIKEGGKTNIVEKLVTEKDLAKSLDKTVIQSLIHDIQQFDTIVTYYGSKFDIPFLRARALYWGLEFPSFGMVQHKDLYYTIKSKFKISRRSLENACRVLLGTTNKTRLENKHWIQALRGNPKSLAYVLHHCRMDVCDLEKLYDKTIIYTKNDTRSI